MERIVRDWNGKMCVCVCVYDMDCIHYVLVSSMELVGTEKGSRAPSAVTCWQRILGIVSLCTIIHLAGNILLVMTHVGFYSCSYITSTHKHFMETNTIAMRSISMRISRS
jgi:hypothetical protein